MRRKENRQGSIFFNTHSARFLSADTLTG